MGESLIQNGFNAEFEASRLNTFSPTDRYDYIIQQRESVVNHLAEDEAVSILYPYYINDENNLFTSSSFSEATNIRYQVDKRERDGMFYNGLLSATKLAKSKPNEFVVFYSPTGKKLFKDTSTNNIDLSMLEFLQKPYTDGQLYFLYFDGNKINNVAVSIESDKNPWLSEILPFFDEVQQITDEEAKIETYLTTPINLGAVDLFFQRKWGGNFLIYTNIHQKKFFLDDIILEMKNTFAGKKKRSIDVYDQNLKNLYNSEVTSEMIRRGYEMVFYNFMEKNNLESMRLGGGCGGGIITKKSLFNKSTPEIISSFSSYFRYLRQGLPDVIKTLSNSNDEDYSFDREGVCINCKQGPRALGPCDICQECDTKLKLK